MVAKKFSYDIMNKTFNKRTKTMSKTKMQELEEIIAEDQKKTYEYLKKITDFIEKFRSKLAINFGCTLDRFLFLDSEEKISLTPEKSVIVKSSNSFEFWLLIKIAKERFNLNCCSKDFVEKRLIPSAGAVLFVNVKHEKKVFTLEITNKNKTQSFQIDSDVEDSWKDLVEFCFESAKEMIEGGLQERISILETSKNNVSEKFGFTWD